ncbi:unnamed protein product [Symbiodinium necroappetens]|uniref:Sugar phosphate/phosphate translocator n=1 Tax=Symbiodinium necroappetens TaxID=1628268 RepID=A0A812ILZ2_9DINO|nr:unnamed protein product [Symbiodinium necroappetens]
MGQKPGRLRGLPSITASRNDLRRVYTCSFTVPYSWFGQMISCRGRCHDAAREAKAQQVPPAEQEQETRSCDNGSFVMRICFARGDARPVFTEAVSCRFRALLMTPCPPKSAVDQDLMRQCRPNSMHSAFSKQEADPLLGRSTRGILRDWLLPCLLPPVMILASASLIRSNQHLMQPAVFPHPFVLVTMHCFCCSFFSGALLLCKPSLFPALTDPDKMVDITPQYYLREILPIAGCFAVSLVTSNMAYKYCTVAFLQMMKESNIVTIYLMSVAAGIENFSLVQSMILVAMVCATWTCVQGELHFSALDLLLQASSSLAEAAKTIFQCLALAHGSGKKLDPLSAVLVIMPLCGLLLAMVILFHCHAYELSFVTIPTYSQIFELRSDLALNVANAFVLNVLIAMFLKILSPVAYILTGNVKDIAIVVMSALLMHESISNQQICGFSMQVALVFLWSALKQLTKKSCSSCLSPASSTTISRARFSRMDPCTPSLMLTVARLENSLEPLDTFAFDCSKRGLAGELANVTNSIDHLQGDVSSAEVMRVRLDGHGDTLEIVSTIIFTMTVCVWLVAAFKILSWLYPALYSQRELEQRGCSEGVGLAEAIADVTSLWHQLSVAMFLKEEDVLEVQGLDAWMHMQFQWLSLRIIASLCLVPVIVCPLHWTHVQPQSSELFSRFNLAVNEDRYFVLWIHVGVVWAVVTLTTRQLHLAMKQFVPVRYRWLSQMDFPQSTTVLVQGMPESMSSDARLQSYFAGLFGDNAVVRCYVVRNTRLLQRKLERLRKAERELAKAVLRTQAGGSDPASSELVQSLRCKEEVTAERVRLGRLSHALDPDVCTSTGFVTFRTRLDMRLAAREQLGTDAFALVLQQAPSPMDVSYDALITRPSFTLQRLGALSTFGVFLAFVPAVVFVSTLLNLNSWQQVFPAIGRLRHSVPIAMEMLEGVLATLSLKLMLSFVPAVLLRLVRAFSKPVSNSSAQLQLQRTYFAFLVVFVLLVTSFAQGLITTLLFVAQQPTAIVPLLAKSLPLTSRFYVNYLVLGWGSCMCELLRPAPLVLFLSLREFTSQEDARIRAEEDSVLMGTRAARSTFMLVIALVFCSICPLVLLVAFVYFLLERFAHGYLFMAAEPRQGDTGGEIFVQALKQVHVGLMIYVLLMVGVLGARGAEFSLPLVVLLLVVMWSLHGMEGYLWANLPLDRVFDLDDADPAFEEGLEHEVYEQAECRAAEPPPSPPQIVVSRVSLNMPTTPVAPPAAPSVAPPMPARSQPSRPSPGSPTLRHQRAGAGKPPEETGTERSNQDQEEHEF